MLRLYKPKGDSEICYYIQGENISSQDVKILGWLLDYPDKISHFGDSPAFEVGPRMNWISPWSSTVQSILQNCGVTNITRVEKSTRSLEPFEYDEMTEEIYPQPLERFGTSDEMKDYSLVEVEIGHLRDMSEIHGFGWDEEDIKNLEELFSDRLPRVIELFDLAQSNSEHCRHHFFRGKLVIDGVPHPHSLFDLVKRPYNLTKHAKIAFCDDASAIEGSPGNLPIHSFASEFDTVFQKDNLTNHIKSPFQHCFQDHKAHPTFTAETHNFPTGISPYSGAMTGVGGRQRDNHSVGRGGDLLAGTAGYCVGKLGGSTWNSCGSKSKMASPLKILIEASNGVSDYGNRVGEPLIQGFMREWHSWVKPILFSGGVGQIWGDYGHRPNLRKGFPVAKLGGPAYRIGVGGGSASSRTDMREGDENAVQRGDPLMNQKVGRVIQTCMRFTQNPIAAISDQGAGGNANVLKELVSPLGAEINLDKIIKGDETLTPLEVWIAEYQEAYAVVVKDPIILAQICEREGVPFCIIGEITDTGRIIVKSDGEIIVDLDLQKTVENVPRKTYYLKTEKNETTTSFKCPKMRPREARRYTHRVMRYKLHGENIYIPHVDDDRTILDLWENVVKLPSVGSKRFLTVKVDRSVGGLVAQQQCVGPFYTPLSNVAVTAQEFYNVNSGIATSIGEKPLLSLIDPRRMARMTVAEALTNLVWAKVELNKVNCSGNWMWPDKDADLVDAVEALSDMLVEVGVTLDGGKDSLSMEANGVKAPGSLVVSCYANCVHGLRDIITPVLTLEANNIYLLTLGTHKARMGGSALAQVCGHVGDECPDVESPRALRELFNYIQSIRNQIVCGHDRSDGGLITCLAEMCIAGNCPMSVDIGSDYRSVDDPVSFLFNEEVGIVIGTKEALDLEKVPFGVTVQRLGQPENITNGMTVWNYDEIVFNLKISTVRYLWEKTSFKLDAKQSNPDTVKQEQDSIHTRKNPEYTVTFPFYTQSWKKKFKGAPRVAILRSKGTNDHRGMAAAFDYVGFETWDVHTNDLKKNPGMLKEFRGLIFPGGFSFGDSLGSGRGFAALLKFNDEIQEELGKFYSRGYTFSLGVCNGFQVMTHLNIFGPNTKLLPNISGRFESRCVSVKIWDNGNIFFKGMGGSVLPIICSHAEGRFVSDNNTSYSVVMEYANDDGVPTSEYPFSPNGSRVAGIVSPNGRHLACMPHPDRYFLPWQLFYNPHNWKQSPWLRVFQNIREWCEK